jgi:hypothetical protein
VINKQNHLHRLIKTLPWLLGLSLLALSFVLFPSGAFASKSTDAIDPIWGADTSAAPAWLAELPSYNLLYTQYPFANLAGKLIAFKDVDASSCTSGPYLPGGAANECSLPLALPAVYARIASTRPSWALPR